MRQARDTPARAQTQQGQALSARGSEDRARDKQLCRLEKGSDCHSTEQDTARAGETAGGGARGQGDSPTGPPTARAKEEDMSEAGRHETGGVTPSNWNSVGRRGSRGDAR